MSRTYSKSDTNTTGSLRKILPQNERSSKLSKSTSNVARTSNRSKLRGKSASGKTLGKEIVNELVEEATPAESQERTHDNSGTENEESLSHTSRASNAARSSVKNKVNANLVKGKRAANESKQVPRQQESPTDATVENQQIKENSRSTNKCFDDWKDFYIQIFGCIKSKSDLVVAFTHYILMKNGFRCVGLGDDRTYAEDEVGSIDLPEGWNHFPKYAIRYIYNRMLHILLAIHLDQRLLINLLNTRTNVVTNITIFPEITVRATCGGPIDVLIPYPEKLAQSLYCNLMQTFTDTTSCDRPPKILSRNNHKNDPWAELEARHSRDVYPITEEDIVSQIEEIEDVQTLSAQNKRYSSISASNKSARRTSIAEVKPHTANVKKLMPLKAALDAAVPPLKDAIASYMEAMVENWCRIYGREVMKSGKLAIQDLAEQRKIIEKYIDLCEPVTEPKGGFVIYNTKISLDDTKSRMLHESVEKCLQELKVGTRTNESKFVEPFTERANKSELEQVKVNNKADSKNDRTKKVTEAVGKPKTRTNYKHIQPKVNTGIRTKKILSKLLIKKEYEKRVKVTSAKSSERLGCSFYNGQEYKQIKNALLGQKKSTTATKCARNEGGSDTYSLQQNSSTYTKAKQKRRRVPKLKATTSATRTTTKSKSNNVAKVLKSPLSKLDTPVRLLRSSPIKKIRFNLPKSNPPSYLSEKWPSTYRSVENLLNSSFPFRAASHERERGGSEQREEILENYSVSDHLTRIDLGTPTNTSIETKKQRKRHNRLKEIDKFQRTQNTSYQLKTIEQHFADQIEAKRLELLAKVRGRSLPVNMEDNNNIDMKNKFIQPQQVKDVGSFVQPADEWSQWEFKKKLKEIREKECLGVNQKK